MRLAYNRDFEEARMLQKHLLDFARVDVAAAADDHVLGAVAQGQKPVLLEAAAITGMQPAAAQGFGTGGRVLPIALHHAVAAGDDLADFAGRHLAVPLIDHFDEDAGARHAARAEPLAP